MRLAYIDVENPITNIYDAGDKPRPGSPTLVFDHGGSMDGHWQIVSIEPLGGQFDAKRVNIVRVGDRSQTAKDPAETEIVAQLRGDMQGNYHRGPDGG